MRRCDICYGGLPYEDEGILHCDVCADRYPDALLKALNDPFDYALKLRTGDVIRFCEAKINGDWVHLYAHCKVAPYGHCQGPVEISPVPIGEWNADRGIDVRFSDIVWVVDAPRGSLRYH